MKYSNSNLIIKIIHLLSQKRDGLILLDGNWGTGKTHFIRKNFPSTMIKTFSIIFLY
ncbi:TPA: P-loop NTPase fold protein [Escherichia coli]|uniref:P-loop NTPase fold protein n=1 Tax=Escherichia coli TaxID=562 RepID=UPI00313EDC56